ncbi:MAG TPA: hypothetical protein VFU16_08650 [Solirubrobacterales bacterium]|nr:hypothetical protein [Solirubrobacterales bacterium]
MARIIPLSGVLALVLIALGAGSALAMPPSIVGEGVSGVTETDAVLEASIIPGHDDIWEWDEAGGAYYQFQIAKDPSEFWPEVTCPEEDPEWENPVKGCLGPYGIVGEAHPQASITRRPGDLPTWGLAGSSQPQQVALDLSSAGVALEPSTTYHYRVIAVERVQTIDSPHTWHTPPVYGVTESFATPPYEQVLDPSPELALPALVPSVFSSPAPQVGRRPRGPRCRRAKTHRRLLIAIGCRRSLR